MYISKRTREEQTELIRIVDTESTMADWFERGFLVEELMRLARSYQRLQENACNYGLTPRQETRERNIEKRIVAIVAELGLTGVVFQGDPRGATVKVKLPSGKTNDWGQTGYCVPTF